MSDPYEILMQEPEHPLLPLPTREQVSGILKRGGVDALAKVLQFRRTAIARASEEPLAAPRPKVWRIAGRILRRRETKVLTLLGGNRSTKSFYCADDLVRTAVSQPPGSDARFLVGSETENSSIETAQKLVWHFLPQSIKALNEDKRSRRVHKIAYSIANGFSDRILVLPNGAKIKFCTYNGDPDEYEGWEFGPKDREDGPCAAWWMDENLPLSWWNMLERRGKFRPGYGLWSFTPIRGITSTIVAVCGKGKVRSTRKAVILPQDRVLVPGLRPGRVPFVQDGIRPGVRVVYFHSDLTPFGSGGQRYSETVRQTVEGKPLEYALRIYYGVTSAVVGLAFPKYSRNVHWTPTASLPWQGTNFVFIDPAGDRSWFVVWVRVAPGNPSRFFIYRDWPDRRTYDEWAVPTTRTINADSRKGVDGDAGPAQRGQGWGVSRYKRMMLQMESVPFVFGANGVPAQVDPFRRHMVNRWMREQGCKPEKEWQSPGGMPECAWSPEHRALAVASKEVLREPIYVRKMDPRAAAAPQQSGAGRVTIPELFAVEDRNEGTGVLEAPSMLVLPANSGRGVDDGLSQVNTLLDYDETKPVCPVLNEPRLYVADACEQIDGCLQAYTGRGAEDDGWKDPADLLRYIAQDPDLRFIDPSGRIACGGPRVGR